LQHSWDSRESPAEGEHDGRDPESEGGESEDRPEGDVLVDRSHDGVALMTLNRPHHLNALTSEMLDEIYHTFEQLGVTRTAG